MWQVYYFDYENRKKLSKQIIEFNKIIINEWLNEIEDIVINLKFRESVWNKFLNDKNDVMKITYKPEKIKLDTSCINSDCFRLKITN